MLFCEPRRSDRGGEVELSLLHKRASVRPPLLFVHDKTTFGEPQSSSCEDEDECALIPLPWKKESRMTGRGTPHALSIRAAHYPVNAHLNAIVLRCDDGVEIAAVAIQLFVDPSFSSVERRHDATSAVAARRNCPRRRSSSLRGTSSPRARTEKAHNTYYTRLE